MNYIFCYGFIFFIFLKLNRSFLPYLYIGLEYTLSGNLKLGERFYQQALRVECDDPFVLHELGVIWFKSQKYLASFLVSSEHSKLF
jgi:hypothetical protein